MNEWINIGATVQFHANGFLFKSIQGVYQIDILSSEQWFSVINLCVCMCDHIENH
jgi:hypothetical protein